MPKLVNLRDLTINSQHLAPEHVCALAQALPQLCDLQCFTMYNSTRNLLSTPMCDEAIIRLIQALPQLKNLQHLNLGHRCSPQSLRAPVILALANTLPHLTKLKHLHLQIYLIDYNKGAKVLYSEMLVPALQGLTNLQQLGLTNARLSHEVCGQFNGSTFTRTLKCLSNLQHFSFADSQIDPAHIDVLSNLQHIDLYNNRLGTDGILILAKKLPYFTNLQQLILASNAMLSQGAIILAHTLPKLTSLQLLDLTCNGIGPDGAFAFAKSLLSISSPTNLQYLNLNCNNIGNTAGTVLSNAIKHVVNRGFTKLLEVSL